jgi:hypothetical protein
MTLHRSNKKMLIMCKRSSIFSVFIVGALAAPFVTLAGDDRNKFKGLSVSRNYYKAAFA